MGRSRCTRRSSARAAGGRSSRRSRHAHRSAGRRQPRAPREEVLLVLDCFEHVLDAATDIHHLLARVAMLRVVVTSRERLGLSGSTSSGCRRSSRTTRPSSSVLGQAQCRDRRRRATGWSRTSASGSTGSRSPSSSSLRRSTSPHGSASRDARALARVDGRRDPPRHRTLRTTLDWSYALLETISAARPTVSVFTGDSPSSGRGGGRGHARGARAARGQELVTSPRTVPLQVARHDTKLCPRTAGGRRRGGPGQRAPRA